MAAVKFQVPACLAPLDPDRLVQRCCPHRARKAYARARRSRRSGRLLKKLVAAVELALAVLLVAVVWLLSTNGSLPTRARASGGGEPRLVSNIGICIDMMIMQLMIVTLYHGHPLPIFLARGQNSLCGYKAVPPPGGANEGGGIGRG